MQHVAMEGRCFVLSCNQFARRRDFPKDYRAAQGDDPETIMSRGGSVIVNPLGQILAGPNYEDECILSADLDMADIARGKYDFDVAGHYARPDVFRLHVNEKPMPAVTSSAPRTSREGDTSFIETEE
jgi:nitrilase